MARRWRGFSLILGPAPARDQRARASSSRRSRSAGHQDLVIQNIGAKAKFSVLGPVTGTSTPAEK